MLAAWVGFGFGECRWRLAGQLVVTAGVRGGCPRRATMAPVRSLQGEEKAQ